VLSGLSPSRAPEATRAAWRSTWSTLEYVVNGLLFLLIGLTLGVTALVEHLPAIALAVAVVLVARALAVVPVVFLLERVASVPRVGRRNEAVLVWGGLRGGVALALALALPEDLADRELLVSLTGGVVLATLLLNATTIQALVHRLGLDRPSGAERFLTAVSQLAALEAARQRLDELGLGEDAAALDRSLQEARAALADLELDDDEQVRAVVSRGLQVERTTYQLLSDAGMLPPPVARVLLHEVDDEVDELTAMGPRHRLGEHARGHRRDVVVRRLLERLPGPAGEDREHDDHAEATARRLAARRTVEALVLFDELPGIAPDTVRRAREVFERWEGEAQARLESLDAGDPATTARLRAQQAAVVGELEGARALRELVDTGVLPERAGDDAS
jgi:CPA1 family monovalent cation:H+ antiporter